MSLRQTPKFMSELELIQEIRANELAILDAQRVASDSARANMYLRNELNNRRRNKAFTGYPVGQLVVISSN